MPITQPVPRSDPRLDDARSKDPCPVCGHHTLTLLDFPHVSTMGVQPYSELLGMGEPMVEQPPGIACLTCGSQWPSIEEFREAQKAAR